MIEVWKDIAGFEGVYQISNMGRVKSLCRRAGNTILREKLRAISYTRDGYSKVRLQTGDRDVTKRIHRLVAEAFLPGSGETVNHKDGNKKNNCVDNLEYMDRHEQMYHAYRLHLKKPMAGCGNYWSKLSAEQVRYIRENYVKGDREFGGCALARRFGVSEPVILHVAKGHTYKQEV